MNEYIFYTAEGYTFPPHEGKEVKNCQVLGWAMGKNIDEARKHLTQHNPWIKDCGFNITEALYMQLVTDETKIKLNQYAEEIEFLINLLDQKQRDKFDEWYSNRI